MPLFVSATACWGVQILFFGLPLAEVRTPHQRRWKVGSILTEAALPGLAASSTQSVAAGSPPGQQSSLLPGTALPGQRGLQEPCVKNRVVTVNPLGKPGSFWLCAAPSETETEAGKGCCPEGPGTTHGLITTQVCTHNWVHS